MNTTTRSTMHYFIVLWPAWGGPCEHNFKIITLIDRVCYDIIIIIIIRTCTCLSVDPLILVSNQL